MLILFVLYLFENVQKTYDATIDTLKQMEKVVESLYEKVGRIFDWRVGFGSFVG